MLDETFEIFFAHQSFKWENNAKNKAAVTVIIVGVRHKSDDSKRLYNSGKVQYAENINPYLISAKTVYIQVRNEPISTLPYMVGGNVAYDSGYLIFEENEMLEFVKNEPNTTHFFKKIMGGQELASGILFILPFANHI